MFDSSWFLVFSLEIVFLGFICLASGCFKSGYTTLIAGLISLCCCGISRQWISVVELSTPENIAASTLLFAVFVILPFFKLRGEKKRCPDPETNFLRLLRR